MITFNVKPLQRFSLFCCLTIVGLLLTGLLSQFLLGSEVNATRLNIVTVVQDVLLFIMPAILTAVIITRQPAEYLQIDKKLTGVGVVLVVGTLIASIPVMNVIIDWNKNLQLPASMAAFESWMRQAEDAANEMLKTMMGESTVISLIVSILTMGIMAGLAEELFFRGGVQRLLVTARVNKHVAVWATAVLFSAIHFQFYGFVPRMLLGAFFGYLCVWSGSLWYSVIAHCFNNIMACVTMWLVERGVVGTEIDSFGSDISSVYDIWCLVCSMVFTVWLMRNTYRLFKWLRTDTGDLQGK
ncbi:MAG: CPBP family intramembrane metalloprotease [Paramuribaculum sp.]|nr:CPBP family intramembrane metalloprotease [Paramuribaculum sp.]